MLALHNLIDNQEQRVWQEKLGQKRPEPKNGKVTLSAYDNIQGSPQLYCFSYRQYMLVNYVHACQLLAVAWLVNYVQACQLLAVAWKMVEIW